MIRQLAIVVIAFLMVGSAFVPTEAMAKKRCLYGKCSYVGDPHLIPFPSSYGAPQNQYWCQKPGWETFVSNAYVSIYVLVGASPYWILDVSCSILQYCTIP
jgi:hypothetical protein